MGAPNPSKSWFTFCGCKLGVPAKPVDPTRLLALGAEAVGLFELLVV